MKKLTLLLAAAIAFGSSAFAQTKKIAHRSHSGKNSSFTVSEEGNFGLPSDYKSKAVKDSSTKKTGAAKPDSSVKPKNTKASFNKKPKK